MRPRSRHRSLQDIATVADPLRASIYELVTRSRESVGRDEVARELGLARHAAAFQLDRLAEQGLLTVEFRRLNGATGPGSGRPSKVYRATRTEISASVPQREYTVAADIMAEAIDASRADGRSMDEHLVEAARETGRRLAAGQADVHAFLASSGYRPEDRQDGATDLTNCPFHSLANRHTDTVCGINQELICGALETLESGRRTERVEPDAPCGCCVRLAAE